MASQSSSPNFFDVVLFLLSTFVTSPSFMSILSLVLELWQFFFKGDWPVIWKSKMPPSEFFSISRDWNELGIPNLERMSLIKCYWMLVNDRVTAFTVSELLRENQQWVKLPLTQIRVKNSFSHKTPPEAASKKFINFSGKDLWRRHNRFIFLINITE